MNHHNNYPESDPRHHTMNMRHRFDDLIDHLRDDVRKVNDPQAQALFETAAEVLGGLSKAFSHFEQKSEEAWK